MVDLIICEFEKMKRQKIIPVIIALSTFFPLLVAGSIKLGMNGDESIRYLRMKFDFSYTMMFGYGMVFLEPFLLGVLGILLFFKERDADTFKNIKTVPVSTEKLILSKIIILLICSIIYSLINMLFLIFFAFLLHAGEPYGLLLKFMYSVIFGGGICIASLPVIVLIIWFNKSYMISTIFAFFYCIFNWCIVGAASTDGIVPKVMNFFPVICVMNWISGKLVDNNIIIRDNVSEEARAFFASSFHTACLLSVTTIVCLLLMFRFYKKWER